MKSALERVMPLFGSKERRRSKIRLRENWVVFRKVYGKSCQTNSIVLAR